METRDDHDWTADSALWKGVLKRDPIAVSAALDAGADADSPDESGTPAVVAATKSDDVETVKVLLDAGADPDAKDGIQDSAFEAGTAR